MIVEKVITLWLLVMIVPFYAAYLDKKMKRKNEYLFNGVLFTDALVHVISVVLISGIYYPGGHRI